MAFGGNCPQCALSHYACQHLLSSTNYNPDPQLLSKYVIRANVTATKFVCLEKAGYLLPGPHKLCPVKCPQIVLSVGWSIINCNGNSIILGQNPSSRYFSPKGRTKYFNRKIYFLNKMYLVKMSQVRFVLWSSLLVDSLHFLENVPEQKWKFK